MARKSSSGVNLSEKIREVLQSGVTSPKEVVEKLAGQGIEVKIGLVNNVKTKMNAAGGSSSVGKRGPKPKAAVAVATPAPAPAASPVFGGRFSIQDIQNISSLAKATGGYDSLIALLQAMKG